MTDAVVSPGSRSTPLVLALAADDRIRTTVVLDERSAAFTALGMGIASGRPAVVVTTSGTAAVELHAAIVEAHHAGVPLLAVTADRPPELRDVGAPQTVDQTRLFGPSVRWFADPGPPDDAARSSWRSLAARAVTEALAGPGPVHLNLPFREPLLGAPGPLPDGRTGDRPWHDPRPQPPAEVDVDALAPLAGARRGVVVAGRGAGDPEAVHALADAAGWPVLADPTSGCRVPHAKTVAAFDALLRVPAFVDGHRPDAVLRLGGTPASKVLAQWLAALPADVPQLVVSSHAGGWPDPDRTAAAVVRAHPEAVCWSLAELLPAGDRSWWRAWAEAEAEAQAAFDAVLMSHGEPTEPGVARAVVDLLPAGAALVVSSSMPVRDVEWYGRPRPELAVFANRGANGIDGVVSTAMGVAAVHEAGPTAALLGDLAFLHDAGGLLGAAARGIGCTFVVVDNGGGGIFSFLPQRTALDEPSFERLFGTPHEVDLGALAAVHGVPVVDVKAADEVAAAVTDAVESGGVRLVLVRTERDANVAVHDELHAAVSAAIGR